MSKSKPVFKFSESSEESDSSADEGDFSSPAKTISELRKKFECFLKILIAFYITEKYSTKEYDSSTVTIGKFTIHRENVRGDGSCLYRALITSYLLKYRIKLPPNPFGMEWFIKQLKYCVIDLINILSSISENTWLIDVILSNPSNSKTMLTIEEWVIIILNNSYMGCDGDITLLSLLFGLLSDTDENIRQIAVIRSVPKAHDSIQIFNCKGNPLLYKVSLDTNLIISIGSCHFMAISSLSGELPPITCPMIKIVIPN